MADRPILFSAPMVRALIAGTKTQTRRIIKPQPIINANGAWRWEGHNGGFVSSMGTHVDEGFPESARHWSRIQPGDRLYVREHWRAWSQYDDWPPRQIPAGVDVQYVADDPISPWDSRFRQGMHMPRWASRITLTVTDVRVERLQEISVEDARAEGIVVGHPLPEVPDSIGDIYHDGVTDPIEGWTRDPVEAYARLWNSIHGPGSWDANPWVVAYSFTVAHHNIDQEASHAESL